MSFRRYVATIVSSCGSVNGHIPSTGLDRSEIIFRAKKHVASHPNDTVIVYEAVVSVGIPVLPASVNGIVNGETVGPLTAGQLASRG